MSERIKAALNGIIEIFESGDIPEAIAYTTFPVANIPSTKWSFLKNQIQCLKVFDQYLTILQIDGEQFQ